MANITRRDFLRGSAAAAAVVTGLGRLSLGAPPKNAVEILNPLNRVPLSFFIDDSTCLVNMGHFCMPQFAEAWPQQQIYKKPWKTWPREIPDAFVREFGQFCAESGVRGKYSIVPFPACVGWLDRELPGWSRRELQDSLKLVRELIAPNFDIHPEMITHTRVIDLRTGKPFPEISNATMENSFPQGKKSVDELAAYLAYALRILHNCDLPCEGITTPGGFGNAVKSELGIATRQAVADVYKAEVPHYFKYIFEGKESTQPKLEHLENASGDDPTFVVNVPAGTGDWFGNWDGDEQPQGPKYANADATGGRMVEMIERGEPAVMLCHWPGLYTHGTKKGFEQFRQVIQALNGRYRDRTVWMKISEIAQYRAARQLTRIERNQNQITLNAPVACPQFTMRIPSRPAGDLKVAHDGQTVLFKEAASLRELKSGTWARDRESVTVCFDLPKGRTQIA